ncbi:MAG: ABC transporter ATP-binding protein, partial [Candidatus Heimdallarchaeota archaeon]
PENEQTIITLAGESGSGKTTTGKLLLRLHERTAGEVLLEGKDIFSLEKSSLAALRRKIQIIYQDPYDALNPKKTIFRILSEPIEIHHLAKTDSERVDMVIQALEEVGLSPVEDFMPRYPYELSGGQMQRVVVARTLLLKPALIVADEPVSMLDVSIRAGILRLMLDLRQKYGITFLFITHDLAVAKHVCDRITVMYLGKIFELASSEDLVHNPLHPYTQALITAVPIPDPSVDRQSIKIKGEIPSAVNIPPGCRFHPRCPHAMEICSKIVPKLMSPDGSSQVEHLVACHLVNPVAEM